MSDNQKMSAKDKAMITTGTVLCVVFISLQIASFALGVGFNIWSLIFTLLGILLIWDPVHRFNKAKELQELSKSNPELYQKKLDTMKEAQEELGRIREERLAKLPACPVCNSKEHVRRIGNIDRTVDVAVWGLASSSVGKQYECTSCRHKF